MLALLLQVSPLLFPQAPDLAPMDEAVHAQIVRMAAQDAWVTQQVDTLRAAIDTSSEQSALCEVLIHGSEREVRLAALLGAGAETPELVDALLRASCTVPQEAPALACLLAPERAPEAWWPALLMLAQDPTADLPVRAAALSRLLDAGLIEVWPIVRSVLLTGTARDEPAPWADWKRGGRYELPKRLLVLSLDRLLNRSDGEGCGLEPNAAWEAQVKQLEALEPRIWRDGSPAPELLGIQNRTEASVLIPPALSRSAQAGEVAAGRAIAILTAWAVREDSLLSTYGWRPELLPR